MLLQWLRYFVHFASLGFCTAQACCGGLVCRAGNGSCASAVDLARRAYTVVIPDYDELDRCAVSISARVVQRYHEEQPLTILHVGPSTLTTEQQTRWLYNWLVNSHLRRGFDVSFVFVEPNGDVLEALRLQLEGYGINTSDASIIKAAMCTENDGVASFYKFSQEIFAAIPQLAQADVASWGSLDIEAPLVALSWDKNSLYVGKATPFLEEVQVRCISPRELLVEANTDARAIDVLIIDSPGAVELLLAYMRLDGFRPAYVRFHWLWGYPSLLSSKHAVSTVLPALRSLAVRGYDIYHSREFFIAVLSEKT